MAAPAVHQSRSSKTESYTDNKRKDDVRQANIIATRLVADAARTSLGPKGMDKMICTASGEDVEIVKIGGTVDDTKLVKGLVFDKKVSHSAGGPTHVGNAKIAVIQFQMSPPKTDIEQSIIVSDYTQMDWILKEERNYILGIMKKIKAKLGADVERDEIEFITKTLNCLPIANIEHFHEEKMGHADCAEEVSLGNGGKIVIITGIKDMGKTTTVLVRGSNQLVFDEEWRATVRERAFAEALEVIPYTLAENAGLTKEELLSFLEVENLNDHNLHIKVKRCLTESLKPLTSDLLYLFCGIWIDQTLPLNPKFKTDAEDGYKLAKVENVDFQHKAEEVIDKVNRWAKDATNGLIKSVLPKGCLDSMTGLVLANALYFKGRWVEPLKESRTENSKFYPLDGNPVEVPFMTSSKRQYITTFEDFKILRLPYEGHADFSMHIILPNKNDGIWPLLENVGTDPKFLEKCLKILKGLGLKLCMSEKAEFDKIVSYFKPDEWLERSIVYQKSYIQVDEKGTEAVAVTVMRGMCGRSPYR
ncbi:T-complex protein 1 subunit delta [Thalictrum thalictroides]|uniref:T-complex protein 1 subunit delta n=1 Tax=Thalictrum thalictroides TaxID=46969 RepID=A0A7J6WYW5_THATH|nr:T-complex protein 1 subunit delta [Thalictrum thalictroides]